MCAVAYRMIGSVGEADDAVQEAWLRLNRADAGSVHNMAAWLTTVVSRICLNMLRARQSRPDDPAGTAIPEQPGAGSTDPEQEAVLADSVGLALLVVLDTLTPAERLAFVLHDLFGVPFEEIGPMLDRSPAAARHLASRARRRVRGQEPAPRPGLARQRRVVEAFLAAARGGDLDGLVAVLDPDVVFRADKSVGPTPEPVLVRGARNVATGARLAAQRTRFTEPALVNGTVGLIMAPRGRLTLALTFRTVGERIAEIDIIADPDRLHTLDIGVLDA